METYPVSSSMFFAPKLESIGLRSGVRVMSAGLAVLPQNFN
jgi:hypothetical protein